MSTAKRFANVVKTGRATALGACLILLAALCLSAAPAQASPANRTWVSGTGSDANSCSRALPCLTFNAAHAATAAGGEINCVDSGSFGGLIITKTISIICEGVVGGVLVTANSAFIISAGPTDVVILRGLEFEGAGTGFTGIYFSNGGALHVENCRIRDFNANGGYGIQFIPGSAAELYVTDTTILHNGSATIGGGVLIRAPAGSTSKVVINQSSVQNNTTGIKADGTAAGGGVINMTVRETASTGNTQNGIVGTMSAGGAAVIMMVDSVAASHNAAGYGVIADGPSTFVHVGGSSVAGNANGVGSSNGGTLLSFKTNQIRGNGSDGTPVTAVASD